MKIEILTILFLAFLSCKNATEKETEQVQIVADSTGLEIENSKKPTENTKLISFLENPIDLQEFKKKKKQSLSSVTNGLEYYWNPKISDSIFYSYTFLPNDPYESKIELLETVVFKYGKNKHSWDDKKEILIELQVKTQDSFLGNANLVGLTKTELESKFGNDYQALDNGIAYSNKNKVLILEIDSSKVKSYRYIKLKTEKIDEDLIGQIIK